MIFLLLRLLGEVWCITWLLKRFQSNSASAPMPPLYGELTQTREKLKTIELHRELERNITQDAMKRERCAKSALTAVLLKQGCSVEQIEKVMDSIDAA